MHKEKEISLQRMIGHGIALLDYTAPWCSPCRTQNVIIRKLAKKYKGKAIVTTINIDENREIAFKMGIHSIPTLIIFKNGREIQRFIGLQSEEALSEVIENMLR